MIARVGGCNAPQISHRLLLAQNCTHAAVCFHNMHIISAVMPTSSRLRTDTSLCFWRARHHPRTVSSGLRHNQRHKDVFEHRNSLSVAAGPCSDVQGDFEARLVSGKPVLAAPHSKAIQTSNLSDSFSLRLSQAQDADLLRQVRYLQALPIGPQSFAGRETANMASLLAQLAVLALLSLSAHATDLSSILATRIKIQVDGCKSPSDHAALCLQLPLSL